MSEEETNDLEKLGQEWASAAAGDLSGLFGVEVAISGPSLSNAARDRLYPKSESLVGSRCEVADEAATAVWIVVPVATAAALAAAKEGTSPEDFKASKSVAFDGPVVDAYTGTMDLCVGILGRVLDEETSLPSVQLGETRALDLAAADEAFSSGVHRCARFEVEVEGFAKGRLDIVFDAETATRWFGEMETSDGVSGDDDHGLRIALVDPSEESRDAFTELADELAAEIVGLDPSELGPETLKELAEVSWVVLAWDLGGRSGLEVLDALRRDEDTCHVRVAIASPAPTRSMVDAAQRWGARTLLFQPWDVAEIRERLTSED